MVRNKGLTILADFFLGPQSPIKAADEKRQALGNNFSKPSFEPLIATVCYIARHT